jgi:hypothetical protein
MDALATLELSAAARRTLDRHILRGLRRHVGADATLRQCVQRVVLELAGRGASHDAIRAFLIRSVQEHPQVHHLDRVSIVTGVSTSAALTRQILQWADPRANPPREELASVAAG